MSASVFCTSVCPTCTTLCSMRHMAKTISNNIMTRESDQKQSAGSVSFEVL